jgi:O-6-methylguanine DNA methyltransferase
VTELVGSVVGGELYAGSAPGGWSDRPTSATGSAKLGPASVVLWWRVVSCRSRGCRGHLARSRIGRLRRSAALSLRCSTATSTVVDARTRPVSQRGGAFTESGFGGAAGVPAGAVVSTGWRPPWVGPRAARAAGTACATITAPFVPCHRVVKSGGSLGNYGYGTQVKAALLKHERALDGR